MAWDYEKHKAHVGQKEREASRDGRDIAPLPKCVGPQRREECLLNLRLYCETYFPAAFHLGWSADHLRVLQIIQDAILHGGLSAVAMPRGSGKTTIVIAAAIWALVYGHRKWVVLFGATQKHANSLLKNIVSHFETNDELLADFPESVYPIKRLDRQSKRCVGQLLNGEPTRIVWTAQELVLPTVPDSIASGARVTVSGLTSGFRGLQAALADGSVIRPDFCLVDDPQTKESARSLQQVEDRLQIIRGDLLGLAGSSGAKISAVAPVTVIEKGDLADQLLDRKKHPEWQGIRTKLLNREPTNTKLWEQYGEIWADGHRKELGIAPATAFYLENRAEMDAGAEAAWPERFNEGEISAIQNAMNLKLERGEAAFQAEYQNDPVSLESESAVSLKPEQITAKVIGLKRGIVPTYATKLLAFVDVQGSILFYTVVAVSDTFKGHVVDYGTWPKQSKGYFFLREVSPTINDMMKGSSPEAAIRNALDRLADDLLTREWERDGGGTQQINRMIIDSGWKDDVVKQFVRESKHKLRLMASKGFGVEANANPMDQWTSKDGDRRGWNWIHNRASEHVVYDTNAWKSFTADRLTAAVGDDGCWTLFQGTPQQHKLFAEQCSSEWAEVVESQKRGRTVAIWSKKPNRDNHWFDCVVGCAVAASEQGALFVGHQPQTGAIGQPRRRKFQVTF